MMKAINQINIGAVCTLIGCGKTRVYEQIKAGLFPPPVKESPKWARWPEHEIEAVLIAKAGGATDDEVRELVTRLMANRRAAWEQLNAEMRAILGDMREAA